jgi:hypothetical protein
MFTVTGCYWFCIYLSEKCFKQKLWEEIKPIFMAWSRTDSELINLINFFAVVTETWEPLDWSKDFILWVHAGSLKVVSICLSL